MESSQQLTSEESDGLFCVLVARRRLLLIVVLREKVVKVSASLVSGVLKLLVPFLIGGSADGHSGESTNWLYSCIAWCISILLMRLIFDVDIGIIA
jgi:hypothetical protein